METIKELSEWMRANDVVQVKLAVKRATFVAVVQRRDGRVVTVEDADLARAVSVAAEEMVSP
jgi:hypothetical protein